MLRVTILELLIVNSLLLDFVSIAYSADNLLFVRPDRGTNCKGTNDSLYTLSYYSKSKNFNAGTTFIFLPGNHCLSNETLGLQNVSNIILKGYSTASIITKSKSTFVFKNVRGLKIEGLKFFLNFTDKKKWPSINRVALRIHNCTNIVISDASFLGAANAVTIESSFNASLKNCTFQNNVDKAVYLSQSTHIHIVGSLFTENRGTTSGAINAHESLVLINGTTFTHNTGKYRGGAIHCDFCKLEMIGTNIFRNNSALHYQFQFAPNRGGAFYIYNGKVVNVGDLHISKCTASEGGAFFLYVNSQLILNGSCLFHGNTAEHGGGGISVKTSSLFILAKNARFVENVVRFDAVGGAIQIDNQQESNEKEKLIVVISGTFIVYATLGNLTVLNVNITENQITAVSLLKSNVTFLKANYFTNNIGGGIEAESSSIEFHDVTVFSNNSSPYGGALQLLQGTLSFSGNVLFSKNKADKDGGAIYAIYL